MALTELTLRRTRRNREAIAEIIQRLGDELERIAADGRLSTQGKAADATERYEAARSEIDGLLDQMDENANKRVSVAQSALDEYLDVTEDKLATRATVYAGLLARAHEHTDEILQVLEAKYGDPVTRRLLLDVLEVVHASLTGDEQKILDAHIDGVHQSGAAHVTTRERELNTSLHRVNEFAEYVATIRQVAHLALKNFVASHGDPIEVAPGQTIPGAPRVVADPTFARDTATMILDRTESTFAAFERGAPNWRNGPRLET